MLSQSRTKVDLCASKNLTISAAHPFSYSWLKILSSAGNMATLDHVFALAPVRFPGVGLQETTRPYSPSHGLPPITPPCTPPITGHALSTSRTSSRLRIPNRTRHPKRGRHPQNLPAATTRQDLFSVPPSVMHVFHPNVSMASIR